MISPIAQAITSVDIRIGEAPPPPRIESLPPSRHGHVWVPGYWVWDGRAYVWASGHWERERRGYHYIAPHWEPSQGQWVMVPGHWELNGPPTVVQSPAPVYIERSGERFSPQQDPGFWYYCHNPDGYYPHVKECPSGWQKVEPKTPQHP
ncbi:MAG TPA: YXWGXW repeat-containing protein [Burkholderiaceae bacterium]